MLDLLEVKVSTVSVCEVKEIVVNIFEVFKIVTEDSGFLVKIKSNKII